MDEAKKLKVLVVDDDQTLLDMYKENLVTKGFEVITATDGDEAITLAKENIPDCILLDILLPKVNGFDVLHTLKSTMETKEIPIILLTALVQDSNKEKGLAEGASDFILKSETKVGDVVQKIQDAIAKTKGNPPMKEN